MYLDFYGLKEKPFNLTPDPRFLYLTPAHQDALSQLLYGVQEEKGFIILTGEVGTGKTTLLQSLIRELDNTTEVALVVHSKLQFDELLEYVLEDFGVKVQATSLAQRLFALNEFLIDQHRAGRNSVLILDEAQHLEPETLEQVRLLSNFETPTTKLLQILLVGQPELKANLALDQLRQLRQRIGLRCSIYPLSREETRDYILSRLRIAGAGDSSIFTEEAIGRIAEYAGGIPRVVNMVCDHCLLFGFADQKRQIDQEIVEQAIEYLEQGSSRPPPTSLGPAKASQAVEISAPLRRRGSRIVALLSIIGVVVVIAMLTAMLRPDIIAELTHRVSLLREMGNGRR